LGEVEQAVALLRGAQQRHPGDFWINHNLAACLAKVGQPSRLQEALRYYAAALALRPQSPGAHINFGCALLDMGDVDGAIAACQNAIALAPQSAPRQHNLGNALAQKGDFCGAAAAYRKVIALDPRSAPTYDSLGSVLKAQGDLPGAIAAYKSAIALFPKSANYHSDLGTALDANGDLDGAIAQYHQAIACNAKHAPAHNNLGLALKAKGDLDGAIDAYKKAIACDPKCGAAHYNLGSELQRKGQVDEAMAAYRKAIACDPKYAQAYYNLGILLRERGDLPGAIAVYKQAIACDPKYAKAHTNLGNLLEECGDLDGAIAADKTATVCDPKLPQAHGALGKALLMHGRFAEASASTRRALQLLPPEDPLRNVVTQQLRLCERLCKLDTRLSAILKGAAQTADADEQLALAGLCQSCKKYYAAAARFYAAAFMTEPELASNLQLPHRYNAACAAALAGCGQGEDAGGLSEIERARLRQQALQWLRADLAAYGQLVEKGQAPARATVCERLEHWQQDNDFAGVRGPQSLAKLPENEPRQWQELWADVKELRQKASKPVKSAGL
jgi:tetratricopeptide (TPR) repeat protein